MKLKNLLVSCPLGRLGFPPASATAGLRTTELALPPGRTQEILARNSNTAISTRDEARIGRSERAEEDVRSCSVSCEITRACGYEVGRLAAVRRPLDMNFRQS